MPSEYKVFSLGISSLHCRFCHGCYSLLEINNNGMHITNEISMSSLVALNVTDRLLRDLNPKEASQSCLMAKYPLWKLQTSLGSRNLCKTSDYFKGAV